MNDEPEANDPKDPNDAVEEFERHRPHLLGIAYRLLGSMWDAEDVVADALVRWLRIDPVDRARVREPIAFLTTMVSRLALDQLRSARVRREAYVGPWLPEPALTGRGGPLDTLERRETLSLATLHLLERLTPPERAVFILREAFDVPYDQLAEILDVTPDGARQLLHRARNRLGDDRRADRRDAVRFPPDPEEHQRLLDRLLRAMGSGDLHGLEDLLAAEAISYSDGGGKGRASRRPIVGAQHIVKFLTGLARRFGMGEPQIVEANGLPAALLTIGRQRELLAIDVREGKIQAIYNVINPDKLSYIDGQLSPASPAGPAIPASRAGPAPGSGSPSTPA
jgi:RNA polymerase sigma-70 factor (ECF subfamily)